MKFDEVDSLWYPSVDDVLLVHQNVVTEDPDATAGVRDPDRIQYAIDFVRHGHFDEGPKTIHEKAFHLMRLIASNHWFADGNKRTALNVTELFYLVNGFELVYGEDVRSMLKLFSVRESLLDRDEGPIYFRDQTTRLELADNPLLQDVLRSLVTDLDASMDEAIEREVNEHDERASRENHGFTTDFDGTVNNDENGRNT